MKCETDAVPSQDHPVHGATRTFELTKFEGAGNDFLVFVDASGAVELMPAVVTHLCDRRRGVGADGVLKVSPSEVADLEMELWNADGTIAEMSGNGMRCLAHAAVLQGLVEPGDFTVATRGGLRRVTFSPGESYDRAEVSVDMGPVSLLQDVDVAGARLARRASCGNPHLVVVVDDLAEVDAEGLGPALSTSVEGGCNVEWVAVRDDGGLDLVVYERGVGLTLACGTGSCAAAAVTRSAGLTGDQVGVHNPGGLLTVDFADGGSVATLTGPVRKVADLSVDLASLL